MLVDPEEQSWCLIGLKLQNQTEQLLRCRGWEKGVELCRNVLGQRWKA